MKSNLKPREKERDLHCANLSCSKEEQYKKCYPQPPEEKKKKKRWGWRGGGGALVIVCTATKQCCQTVTLLSRLSWNANQLSPERKGAPRTQKLRYSRSEIPDLSNKVLPLSGVSSSFGITFVCSAYCQGCCHFHFRLFSAFNYIWF